MKMKKLTFQPDTLHLVIVLAAILLISSCKTTLSEKEKQAFLYGPGLEKPFPVKKDTIFRVKNLHSGSIKTAEGWKIQDFAHSFFNPNTDTIIIRLKMVCDNHDFVFANGQIGTYTKNYQLKPMFGITDNVFICPAFEKYKPNWPVSAGTNFTGSVEFSGSKPFYYYLLHETPLCESANIAEAYFNAWNPCKYDEAGVWDKELNQFIIPYTNYWHNETIWKIGWNSSLVITNNTEHPVIYTIKHIPFYGGQFNPDYGWITRFREQVVEIPVQKQEQKEITLMELFGWSTIQMTDMEGCLLISPDRIDATQTGTKMKLVIVPNKSGKPLHDAIN